MPTTISLTVYYDGDIHRVTAIANEYRSLMHLLTDKLFMDGFGECKGTGRCGTCMVKVTDREFHVRARNEGATLDKATVADPAIRLSCQMEANEHLTNLEIHIL